MKNGDLFFTHSNSALSRAIRFLTGSKVSHVGVILELEGINFCVEMLPSGCTMTPKEVRFKRSTPFLATPHSVPVDFKAKVLKDVGRVKYDFWGLITAPFFRTKGQKKICSEWVAQLYDLQFPGLSREIEHVDLFNVYFTK